VNGRIDGSGHACQRPRTSSGAKCFSCEGALAREIAFLKFLAINVALPEATPSPFGTATLRLAPPPSLRSGSARRPNALRAAQHLFLNVNTKLIEKFIYCAGRSWFAGRSGAQRNEESANREGVASGSATSRAAFLAVFHFI